MVYRGMIYNPDQDIGGYDIQSRLMISSGIMIYPG